MTVATDQQPRKKMPPSLGGGEVSATAMKLLQRSEFASVPQPELIAECVVRVVRDGDEDARSGLRATMNFYRSQDRFPKLMSFLKKVAKR